MGRKRKPREITFPTLNVRIVKMEQIVPNDYNPNKVKYNEMKLLKHSIEEDGYTQPIVTYHNRKKDIYLIVDGFHRYKCARDYFKLYRVPVVVIDKNIKERRASTIRHNRARGTHQIQGVSEVVNHLVKLGWNDEEITRHIGIKQEELEKLKPVKPLKELFKNHEFSKSWIEYENSKKISKKN